MVERWLNRLKQFHAVATRFEKRAVNYRAMAVVASLLIWLDGRSSGHTPWPRLAHHHARLATSASAPVRRVCLRPLRRLRTARPQVDPLRLGLDALVGRPRQHLDELEAGCAHRAAKRLRLEEDEVEPDGDGP